MGSGQSRAIRSLKNQFQSARRGREVLGLLEAQIKLAGGVGNVRILWELDGDVMRHENPCEKRTWPCFPGNLD